MISAFDIFKIGIGPSSSHTVGPMNAGKSFIDRLESSGLLTATSHIVVDLYGSLSLTGKGHATDVAIIMGLAGNSPQDVVIDEIPAFIELVTRSGRLPVASGAHIVDFPVAKNIIFHPEMLPRHENGMRITAWKGQEALLSKTYYSVGGGFIVEEEHFGADDERLARALMLSHLSAIYIHNQLPRLSALCAATTAAMGAAAGMAWLVDGRYETISMAISSMIGDVSGMICDGASNSCAMKVSTSASAAWKAVLMALDDTAVTGNEGIVAHDVEQSIANLCALASHSMQQTDRQIIEIMASKAR
ncbi:serine dehydratase beta chain [Escherichia coli]